MSPPFNRLDGYNIFDDKGEVKRLIESLIQDKDPDVTIESMRKMDYSYLFTPLEIMPRCSAAGLGFIIIPAGFNAPLEFLTGFTLSQRGKTIEVELPRAGVEESWEWRKGKIDKTLIKRITDALIGR